MANEKATIGGGCFWCIEAILQDLKGIKQVVSGFSGGVEKNPSYELVCSGSTMHAEVVEITFDNSIINFKELIEIFLTIHDPTTRNRQGNDRGPQYRSIILYHNEKQKEVAEKIIYEFTEKGIWANPIVTELKMFEKFYEADEYHQNYFKNNPSQSYCKFVIEPKVAKFRKKFVNRLK